MRATETKVVGVPVAYGLETFRNRVDELEHIVEALVRPDTRVVTVVGRRGIGKSALAAKAAERLMTAADGHRPGGIVNVSSRTSGISLERIFLDAAHLLGPAEEERLLQVWSSGRSAADKVLELFSALAPLRCLIVVDNLEDHLTDEGELTDEDLRLLLDLVFRAPRPPRLLITSQVPPALPAAVRRYEARLRLDQGLPTEEAVELLRDLDRSGTTALGHASGAELAEMVRKVYGIPRALELVFAAMSDDYLTMPSLGEMLTSFGSRGDIVAGLAQDRYHRLDERARIVLDVLAVFHRPASVEAVAWVLRPIAPAVDAAPALATLARTHMATLDRQSRTFVLHPLDADLAYAGLPESGALGRRSLERRVAQYYLHEAPDESRWEVVDDVSAYRWAFHHWVKAYDYGLAARLLEQIGEFMVWRGSTAAVIEMHAEVDGHLTDDDTILAHLLGFGFARTIGGPVAAAVPLLERAEELARADGDERKVENALRLLSGAYRPAGRLQDAITSGLAAADLAHRLGNYHNESHSLINVSLAHSYLGNMGDGLRTAERLRELGEAHDDDLLVARARDAKSAAYLVGQRWADARDEAAAAIGAYERSRVTEAIGYARNVLGLAQLGLGDTGTATDTFQLGLADAFTSEQPRVEGFCRYNLAWVYWSTGRLQEATGEAQLSRRAFERAGSAEEPAAAALALAAAAMLAGDVPEASARLAEATRHVGANPDLCPAAWLSAEAERLTRAGAE
ncbi:AAA family ATPase [Micromonospora sp. NPDC048835]|uniref:AAA family ATPase n=1 Tax=Micromonospora sp. NPDC048835 TaxID=3155147 RepID=UPI0033E86743